LILNPERGLEKPNTTCTPAKYMLQEVNSPFNMAICRYPNTHDIHASILFSISGNNSVKVHLGRP